MLRILIADDHGLLRAGLRALLRAEPGMEVVGEASNGDEARELAERLRPDIVLADITMPGPSGIDLAARFRCTLPATRVLVVTMHEDAGLLMEALQAGAAGYLIKRAAETDLVRAIQTIAAGGIYVHEAMRVPVSTQSSPMPTFPCPEPPIPLTEAELTILRLIAEGRSNQNAAQQMQLDAPAFETLRGSLMDKVGVRNRVGLVRYAQNIGLL